MSQNKSLLLKIFFALVIVESAIALYVLAAIPSDTKNALLLGFSASRLVLMGGVLLVLFLTSAMLIWLSASRARMERTLHFTNNLLLDTAKRRALIFICGMIGAAGILFLLTPPERVGGAVYQRVLPIVSLGIAIAIQTLAFQFIYRGERIYWEQIKNSKRSLVAAGIALAGFIAAWIFIAWSGLGITPEKSGWLTPGTPLLAQQVVFAWLIGIVFIVFAKQIDQYKKADIIIAVLIWIIAGVVWYLEPMTRWGYFTPKPTPPNFEYYPYSDASLYDQFGQNILIGTGRQVGLMIRPLYAVFLALLHTVAGQKYEMVIAAQIFIVAVAPALIYLITSKLGGRAAGVAAAILLILREKNSIAVTNLMEVSHSKLLMSELPTLTLLLFFMFFLVYWLADEKNRIYLGILAGAFFGLAMLIRSQSQVLIPVILLGIIIAKWDGWKPVLQRMLCFMLGLLVVVAPWVWRNYQVSGRAVIEYQEAYTHFFASSYADSLDDLKTLPGETVEEYDARMMSLIVNAILSNPQKVFREYFSYFIHNEVLSVTYLPMTLQFKDLYHYMDEMRFWSAPKEQLPKQVLPIFFLTLCIIALGIGTAFQRVGWLGGVVPLLFHFVYSFSVTFIHISGWRFILPVDWVSLLYLSIGLIQLVVMALTFFIEKRGDEEPATLIPQLSRPIVWQKAPLVLTLSVVIGISIPLFEWSFPKRYPAMDAKELVQKYIPNGFALPDGNMILASDVESFLKAESNAVVVYGRALYPSYYKQGQYWGDAIYLSESKSYNRLEFRLIGPKRGIVYIPTETVPKYFPHASDVFAIGCESSRAIRALAIIVDDKLVTTSPWNGLTCNEK